MRNKFKTVFLGSLLGVLLGSFLSYVPQANAAVGAIFDTINRAYFVALTGNTMTIGTQSTDTFTIIANSTPVVEVAARGLVYQSGRGAVYPSASVITPAVTYGAGLGALSNKYSVVATAGPTSQFLELPAPTANIGKTFEVTNYSANPVQIVPASGVVNVSAALTPYACATVKKCECVALTSAGYWCVSD